MLSKLWKTVPDLLELLGLVLIAVAVGALAAPWWGVLVAGVLLVLYVNLRDDDGDATPPGAA